MQVRMDSNHSNEQQFYFQHTSGSALPLPGGSNLIYQPLVTGSVAQGGPMVAVQSALVNHSNPCNTAASTTIIAGVPVAPTSLTGHQQLPPPPQPITKKPRRPKKPNNTGSAAVPVSKNNSFQLLLNSGDITAATELTLLVHQAMNQSVPVSYSSGSFHHTNSGSTISLTPGSTISLSSGAQTASSHSLQVNSPRGSGIIMSAAPASSSSALGVVSPSSVMSTPITNATLVGTGQDHTPINRVVSTSASPSKSPVTSGYQNSVSPNHCIVSTDMFTVSRPSSAIDSSPSKVLSGQLSATNSVVTAVNSVTNTLCVTTTSGNDSASSCEIRCAEPKLPTDTDINLDSNLTPTVSVSDNVDDEGSKDFPDPTPSSTPTVGASPVSETTTTTPTYKMDMEKLDTTMEYVLALALSDEPAEDVFILPPRTLAPRSPSPEMGPPATPIPGSSPGFSPRSSHQSPRQHLQQPPTSPSVTNNGPSQSQSPNFTQQPTGTMYSIHQRPGQQQTQQRVLYSAPNYFGDQQGATGLVTTGANNPQARPMMVNTQRQTTVQQLPQVNPPSGYMYVNQQSQDTQQNQTHPSTQHLNEIYSHLPHQGTSMPGQQHVYIHQSQTQNVPAAQRQVFAMPLHQQSISAFGTNAVQQQQSQPQLIQHTQFSSGQQVHIVSNKSELFSVQQAQAQLQGNSRAGSFTVSKASLANQPHSQTTDGENVGQVTAMRKYITHPQALISQQAPQTSQAGVHQHSFIHNQPQVMFGAHHQQFTGATPTNASSTQPMTASPNIVTKFVHPQAPTAASSGKQSANGAPASAAASPSSTPSPALTPGLGPSAPVTKKRPNNNTKTSTPKRRKTSAASVNQAEQKQLGVAAQKQYEKMVEKLKTPTLSSLIHQPVIRPFSVVLPPLEYTTSETKQRFQSSLEESKSLHEKGMKYCRSPLAVRFPKPEKLSTEDAEEDREKSDACEDRFLFQNLSAGVPDGPLLRPAVSGMHCSPVCASPEPQTMESSLVLMSNKSGEQCMPPSMSKTILRMLHPSYSDKDWNERCSPPLNLHHTPNSHLLHQQLHQEQTMKNALTDHHNDHNNETEAAFRLLTGESMSTGLTVSTNFPTVQVTINGGGDSGEPGSSPLVDSETGEILSVRGSCNNQGTTAVSMHGDMGQNLNVSKEKLHVTFTLSPSMADNVQKMVKNITDTLGINYDSVAYEVTRSGNSTELRLDPKFPSTPNRFQELEQQLRNSIAPLTLRVQKDELEGIGPPTPTSIMTPSSLTPGACRTLPGTATVSPVTTASPPIKHEEVAVSIMSIKAHKKEDVCRHCEKVLRRETCLRQRLSELHTASGLSLKSNSETDELTFCDQECLSTFVECLADTDYSIHRFRKDNSTSGQTVASSEGATPTVTDGANHVIEYREQFFNVPVLLQGPMPRYQKPGIKRQLSQGFDRSRSKKNLTNRDLKTPPTKRWKGSRWRSFSPETTTNARKRPALTEAEVIALLQKNSGALSLADFSDQRMCALCHVKGDAVEDGPGRLLCFEVDKWLHINCALWCLDVYETMGGSLNSVDSCYSRAIMTMCSYCGMYGAGLPCYNPRCSVVYHVPCAQAAGCMFFTDRGMYCQVHQPKEHHMQLKSLAVNRRVYISRDENKQIALVVHEEDQKHIFRIGSLVLYSVGQLLPHQIERGTFHTKKFIYPVGFKTARAYWSMRRAKLRAFYVCEILDNEGQPEFVVTATDKDMPDEVVRHDTCDGAWKIILKRIELLRKENGLVKMFPQHLQGEELFGLTEPHVVRAVESLPGVESLKDYAFKFGRMQLIAEMPLAINPTGCSRSEPKLRTYLRRARPLKTGNTTGRHFLPVTVTGPGGDQTPYSKQYISSRSQQYKRLRLEAPKNVTLGRSRIQGLGLYATRDIEKYTMVIEYIGELIRNECANKREKEYEAHNRGIYMFRIDDNTIVDATRCGGLARYINHSCQPNCVAEVVSFERESHIIIIANKKIEAGEELTYDYKFDLEDNSKLPCLCGAPTCKKWMN